MASIESLKQQLKDLLILNHGDIKITEYPNLVSDGRQLDLNLGQLNQLIQQVYSDIDWRPYEIINTKLELIFRKGILSTDQFGEIVSLVGDSVNRNIVVQYVVAELSKRGFKPREINHPDPLSIQNKWMTDLVWLDYKESLIEVEWLGEKANSLSKLGDISFNNKDDAKYFLRNGNYLPGLVTALTKSATKADEFERIIEEEFDSEKRYLRILYKLNPRLPFRFEDELYTEVSVLLQKACETPKGYQALLESYRKGILQIWIQESDPGVALNLSTQYDLNSFLRFLFKTDATLPFFIENHRFLTPDLLAEYARKDFSIWPAIAESMAAKNIQEWFTGIGNEDWNDQIIDSYAFLSHAGYYTEPEIRLGMVQALFHIINHLSDKPRLKIDQERVQLLSINGGVILNHSINISLKNEGYVKVKVYFKFIKEGISLSKDVLEFNNLESKVSENIDIIIDTSLLQKDQLYNLELVVSSVYEDIIIPVEIKVIFPKKAYLTKLVLYGLITAFYFGAFRFLLGVFLNYNGWLVHNAAIGNPDDVIGKSPLLSFFVFVMFVLGGIFSFSLVKKYEKI
ncbi:hypothetical protein [Dyadobacter frigoris]|uniref:Uncharacterized protein n=1 Tax=Dyadobacter frigoris TaxID=2576211 RepID=A0A4V6BJ09_9BACT|nr:hypothetical protein [Dyadobacter frigoris]TKT92533.1 hypothetical protein FDK13_11275 [Dyadobacter frigoris]GLU55327.1 hypothetical protein Dfri01_47880 [Dyadobacter frigoris]